ncbi:hypothetical protein L1D15_21320 [Vibrio sp. Isolate25]|uniref:hypothetical protein n=1 Tax=Vibrio sp. Isolate25 TaxID=2908535 RepID=UPI001EFE44D5|nr:hypothetical protein [Vibrio sp. Isolate25]MCG9599233.1 hypothetical protein [Vibrio sp. Isolate25]
MKLNEVDKYLRTYKSYMEQIKLRSALLMDIQKKINGSGSYTGSLETDIDIIYLQIRKICELVMLSCVVANQASSRDLSSKLKKSYKPAEINRLLSKVNSRFYPKAVKRQLPHFDASKSDLAGTTPLDVNELVLMWSKSGDFLHVSRKQQYQESKTINAISEAFLFMQKTVTLLSHHWVEVDDEHNLVAVMNPVDDIGNECAGVQVGIMHRVPESKVNKDKARKVEFY